MPINIEGPDGQMHEYPDGTPLAKIQSELSSKYGGPSATGLPPKNATTPAAGSVMPGSQTTPEYFSPEDMENILTAKIIGGPRAAAQAIESTPGLVYRREYAKKLSDQQSGLEDKQRAGFQVLKGFQRLRDSIKDVPDDVMQNAIGPYTSDEWFQKGRRAIMGAAATPFTSNPENVPYDSSYNVNNLMHHDINGLVTEFISAGKAMNMSDDRQKAFAKTMGDMIQATSRKKLNEIADHAEGIIKNSFNLPDYANPQRSNRQHTESTPSQAAPRPQYHNPTTGEVIEWDGKQWQKVH